MLDHARVLRLRAHDVTSGILQEQHRYIGLVAQLQKLRGFCCALWVNRAVVADNAAGQTEDVGLNTHGGGAVARLELHEV